jgi:hypothetical protein
MERSDIEALLNIVTVHERVGCSDPDPNNWYTTAGRQNNPRCVRCALLRMLQDPDYAQRSQVNVLTLYVPYA